MISLPTQLPTAGIARGFTISTKFLGPTNTKGSRITARYSRDASETMRVTLNWEHGIDAEQNHMRAAQELLNKFNSERRGWYASMEMNPADAGTFEIVAMGWDHDHYYFLCAQ